jgi:hypothetical protein
MKRERLVQSLADAAGDAPRGTASNLVWMQQATHPYRRLAAIGELYLAKMNMNKEKCCYNSGG